ncbi:hypothetical protein [Proteiniborus sp. MB09-C3]|uniref:hypothetical protein n=1 Tax=Proteiniborus sp. MB09-C3 TaxID=3050072 RepID=UPI002557399D|nr:hypothetical protein [Proteiniborus sp. MB09-C3]WIV11133.1 hypothetical protein QO263_13370 [Proteiniborus sp. MB09-C3]
MKICEYCGTQVADDVLQCNGCGSKEFKNICINCRTEFSGKQCPTCNVMVGDKPRVCFNCGKETFAEVCPVCREDIINRKQVEVNNYSTFQPKPKKKVKFIITIIFVVGIVSIITALNSQNKVKNNLSYVDLITMEGHPQFFGDYNEAKKFWKGYKKVEVAYGRGLTSNRDTLLLMTTRNGKKYAITNVTIDLSSVDNKQDIKLDNVLNLICDYIPYDIIDKYYTFKESFHEIHRHENYEAYHYVMVINDEGKNVHNSGERYLESKFAFKIIHRNDNDWIAKMSYLSYEGNHQKFNFNASNYDVENWDVDINKYR